MGGWGRRVGAVVAALAVSIVVISIVQAVSGWMYPPPPGLDLTDPEALRAFAEQLPIGALLMVELSYLLGSLMGGVTAGIIGRDSVYRLGAVVGGLLTLAGFSNLAAIPHPALVRRPVDADLCALRVCRCVDRRALAEAARVLTRGGGRRRRSVTARAPRCCGS